MRLILHICIILSFAYQVCGQSFPSYSVTALDTSSAGYYFLTAIKVGQGSGTFSPHQAILDRNGALVYYKVFNGTNSDFKLHSNGLMSYNRASKFYLMDSTFSLTDSVVPKNGVGYDGHELQILPNGHFLFLGYENAVMDLSQYNFFNGNSSPGSSSATVKCGVIQEQDAGKNVVFEWHCKDHYNFSDVDPSWLSDPANVDWTHLNAIELDSDGNFLLSVRHFNEITKIRRSDSSIVWRLGGNANQFAFTNDPQKFKGQHDIRKIANGNITLFDDGGAGPPLHPARAKEYQLDENALTATLTWSYTENGSTFSQAMGNVQREANGNTLVDYGWYNNSNIMFNVVKTGGQKVFEVRFGDTLRSYRAFNYLSLPWSLNRPVITCTSSGGQAWLDAGPGHASYLWSNGATTQSIAVSSTGTFNVWVPKGQGGFLSSPIFTVINISDPCLVMGISAQEKNSEIKIFPSVFGSEITVDLRSSSCKSNTVELYDASGRTVFLFKNAEDIFSIKTTDLAPGMYIIRVNSLRQKLIKSE